MKYVLKFQKTKIKKIFLFCKIIPPPFFGSLKRERKFLPGFCRYFLKPTRSFSKIKCSAFYFIFGNCKITENHSFFKFSFPIFRRFIAIKWAKLKKVIYKEGYPACFLALSFLKATYTNIFCKYI